MNAYYSLIKIATNSLSDDNLTIGLILSTDEGLKFKYSSNKIKIAKSLISVDSVLVKVIIDEITKKTNEFNKLIKEDKNILFKYDQTINFSYFDYLSKYSNGLLRFSDPKYISNLNNDKGFISLYKIFVDDSDEDVRKIKKSTEQFYKNIEIKLIQRVKDRVHTNYKINNLLVPTVKSFDLDCIGLNGALIGAKSLPFNSTQEALSKNINAYISVIAHLSKINNRNLSDNHFYLITDEPAKDNSETHKFWNQLSKSESLFKVIPSNESDEVAELIESNNAHKFLD